MRIALSGAHRTGKTTLSRHLCRRLPGYTAVEEPYRLLEDEGHVFAEMPTVEDFELQLERSIEALRDAAPDRIFDRCPLDLLAYSICHDDASAFDPAHWLTPVTEAVARLDLVVFVAVERPDRIDVSDDDYPGLRRRVDRTLREMIVVDPWGFGLDFIEVAGPERRRVAQVLRAISVADASAQRSP